MDGRALTLLIIDDKPAEIEILRHHLERIPGWDIRILAFQDPDRAIEEGLADQGVDLVLLDYLLGMETGLDVLARLQEQGCRVPVVALTGHGSEEVAVSMMRQGACDYLQKCVVNESSLQRTILNALERHRLETEIEQHRQELERSNRELQRRNEEIQEFQYTVSHEIRNPLAAALDLLNMLLEGFAGPLDPDQEGFVDGAREACRVIHRQVMDLLDNTRLETGKFHLSMSTTSLPGLVGSTVAGLAHTARERGVSLGHSLPEGLPGATVDVTRIRQVLTNLVDNAIKFTDPGGRVTVTAGQETEGEEPLWVEVEDTGRGIPLEQQKRIFERNFQTRDSDATGARGLGLGLHICKEIITAHGGRIRVESAPGEGSRFRFFLPLAGAPVGP